MTSIPPDPSAEALIGLNRLATVARLLSGAAHEVNNALQVISGTVEILEMRADLPPAAASALERLRTQSVRAAGALGRVMAFTRSPRGATGPVNMRELAEESLALRDFAIRRARLSARVEAEPGTAYVAIGNRGDLQQVLLNLIINAEQALAGRSGTIVLRLSAEPEYVALRATDDGKGWTVDPPARAFDPFVTGGEPFETAGLGLWVGRLLVEGQGGRLDVESGAPGATLVLRVPLAKRRSV